MTKPQPGKTTWPEKLGKRAKWHGPKKCSPAIAWSEKFLACHPCAPLASCDTQPLTSRPTVGRGNNCIVASSAPSALKVRALTARDSTKTHSIGSKAQALPIDKDFANQLKATVRKRATDGVAESNASKRQNPATHPTAEPEVELRTPETRARPHWSFAAPLTDRAPTRTVRVVRGPGGPVSSACPQICLQAGELHQQDAGPFDLSQPEVRRQLLSTLGASNANTLERLPGFQGGLNDGVWSLCEPSTAKRPEQEWILKLVKGTSSTGLPTEAQCVSQVSQQHPAVFGDHLLAFPRMTLSCICAGSKTHDLIVMPKAPGQRLCEVVAVKCYSGRRDELQRIIRSVGTAVAMLHKRYPQVQHGDMQPANVFWDESSSRVTFIDIGGMALRCFSSDVEHFEKSLRMLSKSYGHEFGVETIRAFHKGYTSASE